jgi:hypothetical protein
MQKTGGHIPLGVFEPKKLRASVLNFYRRISGAKQLQLGNFEYCSEGEARTRIQRSPRI